MAYRLKAVTIRTNNSEEGIRKIAELWGDVLTGKLPILSDRIIPISQYSNYESDEKGDYDISIVGVKHNFFEDMEKEVEKGLYKRNYEKVVAYNTKKLKVDRKKVHETLKDVDIITFLSSSTVEAFYKSLDGDFFILGDKKIASIGPMTTETIRRLGMKVDYEAKKYTADGLLDVIFK